jgi:hypothetical protein
MLDLGAVRGQTSIRSLMTGELSEQGPHFFTLIDDAP